MLSKFKIKTFQPTAFARFIVFALVCLFLNSAFAKTVKYLPLYIGIYQDEKLESTNIDYAGTFRKLVSIDRRGRTLRINPKKTGVGTLIIKSKSTGKILQEFRLDVRQTSLVKIAQEIRTLLADIEGINIKIMNNKVVVDGQILLPRDMGRIHTVVKQYGNQATTLVVLSPVAQNKIAELIERDINNPEVRVRALNEKFILEGVVDSPEDKTRAEILAKAYVPDVVIDEAVADKKVLERQSDVVINLINVRENAPPAPKKIVQLVVHYVELNKNYSKGFRFQWTPDFGEDSSITFNSGDRAPSSIVTSISGTISRLLPKLNWAKGHGLARVLQSSSIIVEDGSKGTVKSLTNVPYQTVAKDGQFTTSFAQTGIVSSITPQVMGSRSDSIKLNMQFSVEALVGKTGDGPTISKREVQSTIIVRSGQSAAVGGLISSEQYTDFNKYPPGASANPIISFYTSKEFSKNQSQFVVFVTPLIKASASSGSDKIKEKFNIKK
ncbi:MAG: type II and III secretion system protein [Bdellovibrionales bacterium]|nr:type II and III secretion system protein [Bdellovibrionales bacterium]